MFERMKRNGLTGRLIRRANLSTSDSMAVYLVAPIAMANYPKGAELPFLPPKLNQKEIWAATEKYVDGGVGSLDDLYMSIWGIPMDDYSKKIAESMGDA